MVWVKIQTRLYPRKAGHQGGTLALPRTPKWSWAHFGHTRQKGIFSPWSLTCGDKPHLRLCALSWRDCCGYVPLKIGGGFAYLPQSCLQVLGPQATCVGELQGAVCEGQLPTWATLVGLWCPMEPPLPDGKEGMVDRLCSRLRCWVHSRPGLQSSSARGAGSTR